MTAIAPMTTVIKTAAPRVTHALAADLVRAQLKRVEAALHAVPAIEPAGLRDAVEVILSSGGKRIRPTVALLVAGALGHPTPSEEAINIAAAVEMLHTATLVHDDLIDGSLMRRGAATLNAAWTPVATVLTGDFLFAYAAQLAAAANSMPAMKLFAETLGVIVAGELRQSFSGWTERGTREDYERRIYAKTASMFVLATTAMGHVCAAKSEQLAALHAYGHGFGMAFQIIDDILDFTGEQSSVGKPVGADLRRGLITLPTLRYARLNPADPDLACAMRGECDRATYDRLVDRIRHSPAIEEARRVAHDYAGDAIRALDALSDSPSRHALIALADEYIGRGH